MVATSIYSTQDVFKKLRPYQVREICSRLEEKYRDNPNQFIKDHIDFSGLRLSTLSPQQEHIGDSLIEHNKVVVSSGGGTGKTSYAAMLSIWGALCHVDSRQILTGPSGNNVSDNLYSELRFWRNRCRFGGLLEVKARVTHIKHFPEWYIVTKAPPKDATDQEISGVVAGLHARWIAAILDEAANIPDAVWNAILGTCTQDDSYICAISNPVSGSGMYYDIITAPEDEQGKRKGFYFIRLDSSESPLVDRSYIQSIIDTYGKDSNMYLSKVKGYPVQSESNVLVDPATLNQYIEENREYQDGAVVLGVDPNAGGSDKSVYCHLRGLSVIDWTYGPTDPSRTVEDIINIWNNRYRNDYFVVSIDAIGVGAIIYRDLKSRHLFPVYGHMGSLPADDPMVFNNKRTEIYWHLKEKLPNIQWCCKVPDRLRKALVNMIFEEDEKGRKRLIDKKKLKKIIGYSPDEADALSLAVGVDMYGIDYANIIPSSVIEQNQVSFNFDYFSYSSPTVSMGKFLNDDFARLV